MGKSCHGVPADWLGTDGMYPFACYAAHQRPLSLSKNIGFVGLQKHINSGYAFAERQIAHNGKRGKGTRSPHGLKDYPT